MTTQTNPEFLPDIDPVDLSSIELMRVLSFEAFLRGSTDEARHGVLMMLLGLIEEERLSEGQRAQHARLDKLQTHQLENDLDIDEQLEEDYAAIAAEPERTEAQPTQVLLVQVVSDEEGEDGDE